MPNDEEKNVTSDGFTTQPTDKKEKRRLKLSENKSKRKLKKANKIEQPTTFEQGADIVQKALIGDGTKSGKVSKTPASANEVIPYKDKDIFDPEITGETVDEKGNKLTSSLQLFNKIENPNNGLDNRPLALIEQEMEAAKNFDDALTEEQQNASVVLNALNGNKNANDYLLPMTDKMKSPDVKSIYNPASNPPPLTVNDIASETNAILEDNSMSDEETEERFNELFKSVSGSPVNYGEPALEKLGLQDYYPDINTPLQVGTYSGSIVGSNPIFVAGGGYFPMGIVDARKRALERAASNRVKQGEKIKELMLVPSAEQYQDKMHDIGLGIFNKYGEASNWDYNKLMDMSTPEGRAFNAEYQQYRGNAKRTIKIQKQYDKVLKNWEDGFHVPDHVLKTMEDWNSGMWEEGMVNDPKLLSKLQKEMTSYNNVVKDAELIAGKIDKEQSIFGDLPDNASEADRQKYTEELELIRDGSWYQILKHGSMKFVDSDRIKTLVEGKLKYGKYYNESQAGDDMYNHIRAMISTQVDVAYSKLTKPRGTSLTVNNNAPTDVNRTNEFRILADNQEFKQSMSDLIVHNPNDKAAWATLIRDGLGTSPRTDNEGNFIGGVVRADIPLTQGQNEKNFSYTAKDMRFNGQSLQEVQDNILSRKPNVDRGRMNDMKKKYGDDWFSYARQIKSAFNLNDYESMMLAIDGNTNLNARWSDRSLVYKYDSNNNGQHDSFIKTDMGAAAQGNVDKAVPYHEISGNLYNFFSDSEGANSTFSGDVVNITFDYNIRDKVGGLPSMETYDRSTHAPLKENLKQGDKSATKSDVDGSSTPPADDNEF